MARTADYGMGRMPPGLRAQAERAWERNEWVQTLVQMGYSEDVARGMILGAALGCLLKPEPPSESIRRMIVAAAQAYNHPEAS